MPEAAEQAEHTGNGGPSRARPAGLARRRAEDEAVVLDLAAAGYHALNASGALLWQRLDSWATADQLTAVLVSAFGLAPARAIKPRDKPFGFKLHLFGSVRGCRMFVQVAGRRAGEVRGAGLAGSVRAGGRASRLHRCSTGRSQDRRSATLWGARDMTVGIQEGRRLSL